MMLANLAYLLRRHARFPLRLGSLRAWMNVHVATGLLALVFASFHSAFVPRDTPGGRAVWGLARGRRGPPTTPAHVVGGGRGARGDVSMGLSSPLCCGTRRRARRRNFRKGHHDEQDAEAARHTGA